MCCACVNSKAGNCRTCVIAFQPTIQRILYLLLLFLRVIVIVNCTVTLLSTHTHAHNTYSAVYCILFFLLVGVSIQLANIAAPGAFAIETEDVLDIEQCVGVGGGMWQLWQLRQLRHNWQLTAVATFAQLKADSTRAHASDSAPAISEKANQRQETHVTLQFIHMYVFFLRHATKSNLLIANVSDAKRNYSHPHGKVTTRFQVEPSSVECASVSVCECSFIQKDSFAFAIRLREASSRLAPPSLSPFSLSPVSLAVASVNLCASRFLIFEND